MKINETIAGGPALLLFFLFIHLLTGFCSRPEGGRDFCDEKVFVRIAGDIACPGVYGFRQIPKLKELLLRAEGLRPQPKNNAPLEDALLRANAMLDIWSVGEETRIIEGEMSAFHKMTLGIPISLNRETMEGLTAVPGIGPKIAEAIVCERSKRGGFDSLDEILFVQGIGPKLYNKVSLYLVL